MRLLIAVVVAVPFIQGMLQPASAPQTAKSSSVVCSKEKGWGNRTKKVGTGSVKGMICEIDIGSSGFGALYLLRDDGVILELDDVTECEVQKLEKGQRVVVETAKSTADPKKVELRFVRDERGKLLYEWKQCQ